MSSGFDAAYDKAFGDVFDFAVRAVRDPNRAADVVLETMRRVRRDLGGRRLQKNVVPYARGVAAAIVVDQLAQLLHVAPFAACLADAAPHPRWTDLVPANRRTKGKQPAQEQAADATWAALEELPPRDYTLMHLHLRNEVPVSSIAESLHRDDAEVRSWIGRVKDGLDRSVRLRLTEARASGKCQGLQAVLAALPDGTSTADRLEAIETHSQGCDTCGGERRSAAGAVAVFKNLAFVPASSCVKNEILDRINGEFVGFVHEVPSVGAAGAAGSASGSVSIRRRLAIAVAILLAASVIGGGTAAIISSGKHSNDVTFPPPPGTSTSPTPTLSPSVLGIEFTSPPTTSPSPTTTPTTSPTASVTPASVPAAPRVSFTIANRQVSLRWTRPAANGSAIIRYEVQRAAGSGSFVRLALVSGTTYVDRKSTGGNRYRYRVAAMNGVGRGPFSRVITVDVPSGLPSIPQNLQLDAGGCNSFVGWSPPASEGDSPVTEYVVSRIVGAGPEEVRATVPATGPLNYNDPMNGGDYTVIYQVAAVNAQGTGPAARSDPIPISCTT